MSNSFNFITKKYCEQQLVSILQANLRNASLSLDERQKKQDACFAMSTFLNTLQELHALVDEKEQKLCNEMLNQIQAMLTDETDESKTQLILLWGQTKQLLNNKNSFDFFNRVCITAWEIAATGTFISIAAFGTYMFLTGIGLGTGGVLAAMGLLMGPISLVVYGLALSLFGIALAMSYYNDACSDVRFCMGSQVKEIDAYMASIVPDVEAQQQESFTTPPISANMYAFMSQQPTTLPTYPPGYYKFQ